MNYTVRSIDQKLNPFVPEDSRLEKAESLFREVLSTLGFDLGNTHLQDTPRRYIKALVEHSFLDEPWGFTTFPVEGDQGIVLQKNIPFVGLCSHHLSPFFGVAHVAYIPNRKLVGLSKLARTVLTASKGPGTQEGIGTWVADFLEQQLDPLGVGIILEAEHSCLSLRGVRAHEAKTVTSVLRGCFLTEPSARFELMQLIAL